MEEGDGAKETMFPKISRQCLPGTLTWTTSCWEVGSVMPSPRVGWGCVPASLASDVSYLHLLSRNLVTPLGRSQMSPRETVCLCLADGLAEISANHQHKQLHRWVRVP